MKNAKTSSILILCVFCIISALSAQSPNRIQLRGRVIDALTGDGVSYATVFIADTLGVPITSWVTDGNGKIDHIIKASGPCTIVATALGYGRSTKEIEIKAPMTDIGKLPISSRNVEIDGVVVTAAIPLIKRDVDKLTYNVSADPEAPINTLLDMLRKVPLLSVDADDNVLMQGQSNYKVLVNGKSSSMMNNSFKDVVRSMPASSIKNIEVITSPSVKYEAEGIGGIINIITNRSALGRYNGSANLGFYSNGSSNISGLLNTMTGKFTVSGYISRAVQRRPLERSGRWQENLTNDTYKFENTENSSRREADGIYYNLQASYEIDSLNLISIALSGQTLCSETPSKSHSIFRDISRMVVRDFEASISSDINMNYLSGNFDYQKLFRKPDRIFTASYKIEAIHQEQRSTIDINGILGYQSYLQRSIDDARASEQTLQLDYVDMFADRHAIEMGVKFILRQNGSDPKIYYRDTESDTWTLDPSRRSGLDYDQYILGLYGAYTLKLKKVSLKMGARLERTLNDGIFRSADTDTQLNNQQLNVIPYVALSYIPKSSNSYTLSYTQRLWRPNIWTLNPYINDNDPMNISSGNPNLKAEVGHIFNVAYGIFGTKTSINISTNAMFVNNTIDRIATADDTGVTNSTYYNIGHNARYGLSMYYSWRPNGKFTLYTNTSGNYVRLKSNAVSNSGLTFSGNLQMNISLWKWCTAMANIGYNSSRIYFQGRGMASYSYGFGLSQKAFNQKVTFTLSTTMPFNEYLHHSSVNKDPTFYRRSETWSPMRMVRFNVGWNFGKTQVQVKRVRRTITNDDQKAREH